MAPMLRPPVTLSIAFVHGLLQGITERGMLSQSQIDHLLDGAGIPPVLLSESGARVTTQQYVVLIECLIDKLDDEGLGLLSHRLRRGSFALVGRATLGAPSLGVALRRAAHTFRLLQEDVSTACVEDGSLIGLSLEFHNPSVEGRSFLHELLLRIFWQLLAWLNEARLPPQRFDFSFEQPPYAAIYSTVFPALLRFNQPHSTVWFDSAALRAPVRRDELAFRAMMPRAVANLVLPRYDDTTTSARVRALLQQEGSGWPDLETVAKHLHVAASTLQRRLAVEGTSYQSLKDQLRRDMAIALLNTTTKPLTAVAAELGFADSAAFQRAFKGWTGTSPGSYRQRR